MKGNPTLGTRVEGWESGCLCVCVYVCLCASLCSLSLSSETLDVFAHEDAVYGLSVSPVNDNIFASSSDDGRVLIWDIRESPHGGRLLAKCCWIVLKGLISGSLQIQFMT